jgi:hypothetical protein
MTGLKAKLNLLENIIKSRNFAVFTLFLPSVVTKCDKICLSELVPKLYRNKNKILPDKFPGDSFRILYSILRSRRKSFMILFARIAP